MATFHLIQADNLTVMTHLPAASIDTVYLDPPYNTGIDRQYPDRFSHSEWIGHIKPRLVAAHRLLKRSGVILVSIGDQELPRLWLTLEDIFGEQNFLRLLIWQGNGYPGGAFSKGGVSYILAFAKQKRQSQKWREPRPGATAFFNHTQEAYKQAINANSPDPDLVAGRSMRQYARNHDKWMRSYEFAVRGVPARPAPLTAREATSAYHYTVTSPTGETLTSNTGWRLPEQSFLDLDAAGHILWRQGTTPRRILLLDPEDGIAPSPIFTNETPSPARHVASLIGPGRFMAPKDHRALARWLRIVTPHNGVIFDGYTGSGSVFEAAFSCNNDGTNLSVIGTETHHHALALQRVLACKPNNVDISTNLPNLPPNT